MRMCQTSDEMTTENQTSSRSILKAVYPGTLFKGSDMAVEIIEFRQLLEAGRRYLAGATLAELNGRARMTLEAGYFWGASATLSPKAPTHSPQDSHTCAVPGGKTKAISFI